MALMDGSFIDMGACPRGARLCARLSGSIIASLESSGRSSYADFRSVDHDATSGGKQRMTGGQDEPPMADGTQDREVAGVDDPRFPIAILAGIASAEGVELVRIDGDHLVLFTRTEAVDRAIADGLVP